MQVAFEQGIQAILISFVPLPEQLKSLFTSGFHNFLIISYFRTSVNDMPLGSWLG
jgi:hypothetical protein